MKNLLIPIGLFFAGKWIFKKIDTAKNLQFGFVNVDVQVGFPFSKIVITIRIVNPTTGSITVDNINGAISLNGNVIGSILTTNSFNVAANNKVDVDVDVQLNNFTTITAIISFIRNKNAVFNFDGTVTAQSITFPINYDYKIL